MIATNFSQSLFLYYKITILQHAMRVFFLFISLVLQVTVSMASEVKFVSVNTAYGVAFRETASLYEDKNGFIWSSSKTGILRLAGRSYKLYSLPYVTTDVGTIKLVGYASQLYAYTSNAQILCTIVSMTVSNYRWIYAQC